MAWRLRLAPEKTNFDFFKHQWLTFGGSVALMVSTNRNFFNFGL